MRTDGYFFAANSRKFLFAVRAIDASHCRLCEKLLDTAIGNRYTLVLTSRLDSPSF